MVAEGNRSVSHLVRNDCPSFVRCVVAPVSHLWPGGLYLITTKLEVQ